MNENGDPDVAEKKEVEPLRVDPEERLDWDIDLGEFPPPLRQTKILVRLRRKEAEPLSYPDPDDE